MFASQVKSCIQWQIQVLFSGVGWGGEGGGKGAGGKYKKTCLSLQTNLFAISEDTSGK